MSDIIEFPSRRISATLFLDGATLEVRSLGTMCGGHLYFPREAILSLPQEDSGQLTLLPDDLLALRDFLNEQFPV